MIISSFFQLEQCLISWLSGIVVREIIPKTKTPSPGRLPWKIWARNSFRARSYSIFSECEKKCIFFHTKTAVRILSLSLPKLPQTPWSDWGRKFGHQFGEEILNENLWVNFPVSPPSRTFECAIPCPNRLGWSRFLLLFPKTPSSL